MAGDPATRMRTAIAYLELRIDRLQRLLYTLKLRLYRIERGGSDETH